MNEKEGSVPMASELILYPLSNYSFAAKKSQIEEDPTVVARLQRLQKDYEQHGMRTTVEGLLVVHEHGHPHVLVLQVANTFFKLPGDYLNTGESDEEGLKARLNLRLGPNTPATTTGSTNGENEEMKDGTRQELEIKGGGGIEWEMFDLVAQWWRPNFEGFMYPYVPAHIAKPKEVKRIYLVQLPEKRVLTVPENMKLLAVPIFELYDNAVRYGPILAAIPHILSKYSFVIHS